MPPNPLYWHSLVVLATGANVTAAVTATNTIIATQETAGYYLMDIRPIDKTNFLLRFIRQT